MNNDRARQMYVSYDKDFPESLNPVGKVSTCTLLYDIACDEFSGPVHKTLVVISAINPLDTDTCLRLS